MERSTILPERKTHIWGIYVRMKRATLILALLFVLPLAIFGQTITIRDFRTDTGAGGPLGIVPDNDGRPCALLRMRTMEKGWTFDVGLDGIVDVVGEDGFVNVYVPAYARSITIAKPGCAPLREWTFPTALSEGATYSMTLATVVRQQPVKPLPAKPAPAPPAPMTEIQTKQPTVQAPVVKPAPSKLAPLVEGDWCEHFIDASAAFCIADDCLQDAFIGLKYTWLPDRIGPYISAALSFDFCGAIFAGAAVRLSGAYATTDYQVYGGLGLIYGCIPAVEAGVRFGWRSTGKTSGYDFGFGCQVWDRSFYPTIEVGLCIWGVPVMVGLGLCAMAI